MAAITEKPKQRTAEKVNRLIPKDWFYSRVERFSPILVWLFAILIYATVYITVGLSIYPLCVAQGCLSIRDTAEIINGINVWGFFLPMIWALYRWTPAMSLKTIQQLEENGLISPEKCSPSEASFLSRQIQERFGHPAIFALGVIGAVVSTLVFTLYAIPQQEISIGKVDFWYIHPISYAIFCVLYFISNYILFLTLFRLLYTLYTIAVFFKRPGCIIKIYPLHPDRCGGFSGLGKMSTRMAWVLVLVLIWLLVFSYFPTFEGKEPIWSNIFFVYIIYFMIVPALLIVPLWNAHQAMVDYKYNLLKRISNELLDIVEESKHEDYDKELTQLSKTVERAKKLAEFYESIERQVPSWPIAVNTIRRFSLTSSFPLILGILPPVFELLRSLGFIN